MAILSRTRRDGVAAWSTFSGFVGFSLAYSIFLATPLITVPHSPIRTPPERMPDTQSLDCPSGPHPRCPECITCRECPDPSPVTNDLAQEESSFKDPDVSSRIVHAANEYRQAQALPSPLLENLLDQYRTSHRLFYASGTAAAERIIIYEAGTDDGYGNRLPGLITAFVWALLDGRILLTEWHDDKILMPFPAPFGTLFEPSGMELDVDVLNFPGLDEAEKLNGRQIWAQLSQDRLDTAFPQRVIKFHSDDWLFPLFQNNPHYSERVRALFPRGRAFFHLAQFLLPLASELQSKVDEFQAKMFAPNVVGMHLRLQKVMPDDQGRKTLRAPSPETFFETARMVQIGRGMPENDTVFYLATETAAAVNAAREWFSQRNLRLVLLDDMFPMKRKDHRDAERGSVEALHNAIIEMKLLSLADEMVGTFASSYSYCASSWGNVIPYYVMPDRSYWYAGLSEPCFRHASRGHAEFMQGAPELVYHSSCAVTGHKVEVQIAERGKDGKLRDSKAVRSKLTPP